MLILSPKLGDSITIGDILIRIVDVQRDKVRLGFEAGPEHRIVMPDKAKPERAIESAIT